MNFKKFETQVPSEYQEVEYLTSNGTQYIDTNIIPTNSAQTKVQFEFQLTDITDGINQSIGCNSNINFTSSRTLLKFRSNAIEIADFDTAWHVCEMSKSSSRKVTYFDGVEYSTSTVTEEALHFILFGMSLSSDRYYGKYKLKYFKCYENNTLVRNMIPVRRVSDNVLGMYDTVNDEFYVNQGTGTFEAGADVDNWHDTPHYIHKTDTDTITTLPADIYANDTTATVGLKGNTLQSSVPSPTFPVIPQGTGERTGNLFDAGTVTPDYYVNDENGNIFKNVNYNVNASDYININGLSSIYLSTHGAAGTRQWAAFYNNAKTFISGINGYNRAVSVPNNATYLRVTVHDTYLNNFSVVSGNTAPMTYEPYGYKIPISSASTTTPVYLGEVQTTRRVKKLVLKGSVDENITLYTVATGNLYRIELPALRILGQFDGNGICTHYRPVAKAADRVNGTISGGNSAAVQGLVDIVDDYESVDAFKAYLAQQYANGTPVTIWYVLATPETAVVNEPIRKIGVYADEVSGITIPVTAGENTLSVDTTVQPSEVTINYKGWHPVTDVHERENGAWT